MYIYRGCNTNSTDFCDFLKICFLKSWYIYYICYDAYKFHGYSLIWHIKTKGPGQDRYMYELTRGSERFLILKLITAIKPIQYIIDMPLLLNHSFIVAFDSQPDSQPHNPKEHQLLEFATFSTFLHYSKLQHIVSSWLDMRSLNDI